MFKVELTANIWLYLKIRSLSVLPSSEINFNTLYIVFIFLSGGPYAAFGGRDASRGLATFSVAADGDGYDDLSDLSTVEMDSVREWESQFKGNF